MKKKILFIIPSLALGGAEKALVNLLNLIDLEQYEIEVLLFQKNGFFEKLVPNKIKIIFRENGIFLLPYKNAFLQLLRNGNFKGINNRLKFAKNIKTESVAVAEQKNWHLQKDFLNSVEGSYDVAIAFLEKTSIYYLVDKIKAKKKIGWIHTDYNQSGLNADFDFPYFKQLDHLVTISDTCKESLIQNFPKLKDRIIVIPNISSAKLIREMSRESAIIEKKKFNFVTVARLSREKGIDIAIETAEILRNENVDFSWNIIGDGPEKEALQVLLSNKKLAHFVHLLGAKINPYPFVKNADLYIQPSRYEGKSIAVDEALILQVPVVVNNYPSATDQVKEGINGFIAGTNAEELAEKIMDLLSDGSQVQKVSDYLKKTDYSNEVELFKIYELFK